MDARRHSGNETMAPIIASVLGSIEVAAVASPCTARGDPRHAEDHGITEIRGVPIGERFVLATNFATAIAKVRQSWGVK